MGRKDTKNRDQWSRKSNETFMMKKPKSTHENSSVMTFASPTLPPISIKTDLIEHICVILDYLAT